MRVSPCVTPLEMNKGGAVPGTKTTQPTDQSVVVPHADVVAVGAVAGQTATVCPRLIASLRARLNALERELISEPIRVFVTMD